MKGHLIPACSPFSLANGPTTPNAQSRYFGETLPASTMGECLPTYGDANNATEEILIEKLDEVAVVQHTSSRSSPFDSIPNEILSLVFEHGYFDSGNGPPDSHFRILAANISRRFRAVVFHTPSLWSIIYLSPANIFEELDLLPTHIARSMTHPLGIHLTCFWASDLTDDLMEILTPHSTRWEQLSITTMNGYILTPLQYLPGPSIKALSITYYSPERHVALPSPFFANDLPALNCLNLRNIDLTGIDFSLKGLERLEIRGHGTWPSFTRLQEMISHSSRLQHLVLHVRPSLVLEEIWGYLPTPTYGQIHLPELSQLTVYTSEGLSEDIANLIRLFACPKLQILILQEELTSSSQHSATVMCYTKFYKRFGDLMMPDFSTRRKAEFNDRDCLTIIADEGLPVQAALRINSASIYHACNSLAYSGAFLLTSLVLSNALFPSMDQLRGMFTSLKNLENLSVLDLIPTVALSNIMMKDMSNLHEVSWEETVGTIHLPKLNRLTIAHNPSTSVDLFVSLFGDGLKEFLLLFDLPSLTFLGLKHLTNARWSRIVEGFSRAEERYPKLTSLKVEKMVDFLPSNQSGAAVEFANPAPAFPRLETLSLLGVSSNAFLICLLGVHGVGMGNHAAFPYLTSLAISDDPHTSKPLLHRVIAARATSSRPLRMLRLDTSFTKNAESLKWMKERVELVEIIETLDEIMETI